jgi:hypothetical protein
MVTPFISFMSGTRAKKGPWSYSKVKYGSGSIYCKKKKVQ